MAQSPEQQKQYHVTKSFKALNTKANRTAIDESEFSWIENVQPIGFGNLKVIPQSSNVGITWSNTVTELTSVNITNTDYILAFQANGGAEAYNLTSNSIVTIAAAGTFTGSFSTTGGGPPRRISSAFIISPPDYTTSLYIVNYEVLRA